MLDTVACVAEAALPTRFGDFRINVLRVSNEPAELVALVLGDLRNARYPLVRLHSECITGDLFRSLRCDCGDQLNAALAMIAASGCGALLYLPQEGRGIGIANKIRAYALQDSGLDTVDANLALGLPVDGRDYAAAALALRWLGATSVRLLTNNPAKCRSLERHGVNVVERVPLETPANPVNIEYLRTKAKRLGHLLTVGDYATPTDRFGLDQVSVGPSTALPVYRSRVTVHYAQTLDGRIATRTGSSQWISGQATLVLAHQLRASSDAVMVGVGTIVKDDPRLTVRLVEGASPVRVVVDSTLRIPDEATVLSDGAARTIVATTARASAARVRAVEALGAEVLRIEATEEGRVDVNGLLAQLWARGIRSVLVEGGRGLITSMLGARAVDRLVVTVAPMLIGSGIEAIGDLNILRLGDAITFEQSGFIKMGDDLVFDGWIAATTAVSRS